MFDSKTLDYDFPPYRPPNEATSALIRASRGCPWNKCLFCTMYKTLKFKPRSIYEVKRDIDKAAEIYKGAKSVFIADSDSLTMKNIEEIIRHIKLRFPKSDRITSYARAKTLMKLGPERLKKIKKASLTRVHVGLESGDKEILEFMQKGATPEEMIAGGRAAKEAGLELSFYILIGAGGKDRLREHAIESADLVNQICPNDDRTWYIAFLTLMIPSGTEIFKKKLKGGFQEMNSIEILQELKTFISHIDFKYKKANCIFRSNHASNYLPIKGILDREKGNILSTLNYGITHKDILRPEFYRGL